MTPSRLPRRARLRGPARLAAALTLLGAATACAAGPEAGGAPRADGAGTLVAPPPTETVVIAAAEDTGTPAPSGTAAAEDSTYGAYLASRFAEQRSNYAAAASLLDRVLAEKPEDMRLLRRALIANLAAGRFERAGTLADRLGTGAPHDEPLAALTRASRALAADDYAATLEESARIGNSGLAGYAGPILEAWAESGRGNPDAALEALGALGGDGGFERLVSLHSGLIQKAAGRLAAADETLAPGEGGVAEMPARTLRALARVRLARDDAAGAVRLLADYVAANPGVAIAKRDLEALRADGTLPDMIASPAAGAADAFYHLSSGVQQQADTIALVYGRLATFLDPEMALARLLVAGILENKGRHEAAIAELERVASDDNYGWSARLSIADNLIAQERDQAAVEHLEAMAAERPERTDALMKLGYLMRARERFAEGAEVYERVLERIDTVSEEDWLAFYYHGITLERTDRWEAAEESFLKALELKPDDPYVLNYLGYSWVDQGINIERAKEMIRSAVEQRRNDGYIVDSLGWVHYKLGNYEEAVTHLERAVQLRPQDPVINDHLGDAYWRVGRKLEARFQWDRVLSLEPDDELEATATEKLDEGLGPPSEDPADRTN